MKVPSVASLARSAPMHRGKACLSSLKIMGIELFTPARRFTPKKGGRAMSMNSLE